MRRAFRIGLAFVCGFVVASIPLTPNDPDTSGKITLRIDRSGDLSLLYGPRASRRTRLTPDPLRLMGLPFPERNRWRLEFHEIARALRERVAAGGEDYEEFVFEVVADPQAAWAHVVGALFEIELATGLPRHIVISDGSRRVSLPRASPDEPQSVGLWVYGRRAMQGSDEPVDGEIGVLAGVASFARFVHPVSNGYRSSDRSPDDRTEWVFDVVRSPFASDVPDVIRAEIDRKRRDPSTNLPRPFRVSFVIQEHGDRSFRVGDVLPWLGACAFDGCLEIQITHFRVLQVVEGEAAVPPGD